MLTDMGHIISESEKMAETIPRKPFLPALSAETNGEGKKKKFFPRKQTEKERKKLLLPRRGRRRNEIYFVPIFPIFARL